MTIEQYTPEKLDQFTLRLFDVAADIRDLAKSARDANFNGIPIHDKKALLWVESLEIWVKKSQANYEIALKERK